MTKFKFKLTTQVQLEHLESNARTFGELKEAIKNSPLGDKISFERKSELREEIEWIKTIKLVEKNTLAEFGAFDEAALPAGDSIIFFVTPVEHKGGIIDIDVKDLYASDYEEMREILSEEGSTELASFAKQLNYHYKSDINTIGKRNDILFNILEWLNKFYENLNNSSQVANEQLDDTKCLLNDAIELISNALDIIDNIEVGNNTVDGENTIAQLHEKALDLQRRLNK